MSRNTISKPESARTQEKAVRACLRCGDDFASDWRGHRICGACKILVSYRNDGGLAVQWEGCAK